jgi:CheY-like chemotaxis protein
MSRMRILAIEDDKSWRSVIQHTMSLLFFEYSLVIATDFEDAKKWLDQESFDVVILDMALSEMEEEPRIPGSGWLLIPRLRMEFPETHIIVVSGSRGFQERPDRVAELLSKYKIDEFLWKADPDTPIKLHQVVTSIFFQFKESNMTDNFEKLQKLKGDVEAVESAIGELKRQQERGDVEFSHYLRLFQSRRADLNNLVAQIDALLTGPDGDILRDALNRSSKGADEAAATDTTETVKEELRAAAETQGWGQKIIEQINAHRGEIVSLVVSIALELGKRAIAGM